MHECISDPKMQRNNEFQLSPSRDAVAKLFESLIAKTCRCDEIQSTEGEG